MIQISVYIGNDDESPSMGNYSLGVRGSDSATIGARKMNVYSDSEQLETLLERSAAFGVTHLEIQ